METNSIKRILKAALVAATLFFISISVSAQEPGSPPPPPAPGCGHGSMKEHKMGRGPMYYCLDSIPGITADQKAKIEALRDKHKKEMEDLRDQKQKTTSWDEWDKLEKQMVDKRVAHRNEIRNILNDAQKKFFDENFFKKKKEYCDRKHKGGRHGKWHKD